MLLRLPFSLFISILMAHRLRTGVSRMVPSPDPFSDVWNVQHSPDLSTVQLGGAAVVGNAPSMALPGAYQQPLTCRWHMPGLIPPAPGSHPGLLCRSSPPGPSPHSLHHLHFAESRAVPPHPQHTLPPGSCCQSPGGVPVLSQLLPADLPGCYVCTPLGACLLPYGSG